MMSSSRSDMLNSRFCRRRIPICEQYHSSLPGSRDPPPNTQHLQRQCHIYHLKLSLRYVGSIIPGSLLPAELITITLPGTISFKHIKLYHMFSKFLYIYSLKDLLAKIDKTQYNINVILPDPNPTEFLKEFGSDSPTVVPEVPHATGTEQSRYWRYICSTVISDHVYVL